MTTQKELKLKKQALTMRLLADLTDLQLEGCEETFEIGEELRAAIVAWEENETTN